MDKKKSIITPIVTVLIIAVVAVIIIYALTGSASTILIEGDSLTVSRLSAYEQKIVQQFGIDSSDLTLLYDSSVSVESGDITDLNLKLALVYGESNEYWTAEDADGGINMTYKKAIASSTSGAYPLSDLSSYLVQADAKIRSTAYTATFYAEQQNSAEYASNTYIWNGESFDPLTLTLEVECYKITVFAASEYTFYVT